MPLKIVGLFILTALMEIAGCYFPYLWLKKGGSIWLLLPAIICLALFVWLLSLHPEASGRIYATYGGIYIVMALIWLRFVDGVVLASTDWLGALIVLVGVGVIVSGWK